MRHINASRKLWSLFATSGLIIACGCSCDSMKIASAGAVDTSKDKEKVEVLNEKLVLAVAKKKTTRELLRNLDTTPDVRKRMVMQQAILVQQTARVDKMNADLEHVQTLLVTRSKPIREKR